MKSLREVRSRFQTQRASDEESPAWEVALLFPPQGQWREEDYLALKTNRLVEFVEGRIEVLPMPTLTHQRIVMMFIKWLLAYLAEHPVGELFPAPVRLRVAPGRYREPDLVLVLDRHSAWKQDAFLLGADWVLEVVSPDDPSRDYVVKRQEYALAGISEYWIADPERERVLVLSLQGEEYQEVGAFEPGQKAVSTLLDGFWVDVAEIFQAENADR